MLDALKTATAPGERSEPFGLEGDGKTAVPFVLLAGAWLNQPEVYGDLSLRAMQEMVRRDDVVLCSELLARFPEALEKLPRAVLQPEIRDLVEQRSKVRITRKRRRG